MAGILVLFVMVIYFITGLLYFKSGNIGLGIVFVGYAFSNIGLYIVGSI